VKDFNLIDADDFRKAEQRRLAWRCRRGMLELDIVLQAFVRQHFDTLDMEQLHVFDAMLALADNDFWALINKSDNIESGGELNMDATIALIEKIKSFRLIGG